MMNKWQQERAVMDELLRMEEAGEVRQNPDTGKWETTELGRQVVFEQMQEDYGILGTDCTVVRSNKGGLGGCCLLDSQP
jgi:hypothetical protein